MLITIDPYYDVQFYNETKEALANNGVEFKEYISTKAPFEYYLDVPQEPIFVNYDKAPKSYSKWLINVVLALKPNDDYLFRRRESYTNTKAINHYGVNKPLQDVKDSGEGVFFTSTKEQVMRISRDYPRKIHFMGKYYNNKFRLFLADSLMIKNFLNPDQILVENSSFKSPVELELELNFKVFKEKDRLLKISETPYIKDGKYHPLSSVRAEMMGKFVLS